MESCWFEGWQQQWVFRKINCESPSLSLLLPLCVYVLQKMFGVCVHPQFGGWFAIRALLVFVDLRGSPDLQQPPPVDCVPSKEDRIQLLEAFNLRWQVQITLDTSFKSETWWSGKSTQSCLLHWCFYLNSYQERHGTFSFKFSWPYFTSNSIEKKALVISNRTLSYQTIRTLL